MGGVGGACLVSWHPKISFHRVVGSIVVPFSCCVASVSCGGPVCHQLIFFPFFSFFPLKNIV